MWSCGIAISVAVQALQAVFSNDGSAWDYFKYNSLMNDDAKYSLVLFGNLIATEYVPLISLLISLVISYRNNISATRMTISGEY